MGTLMTKNDVFKRTRLAEVLKGLWHPASIVAKYTHPGKLNSSEWDVSDSTTVNLFPMATFLNVKLFDPDPERQILLANHINIPRKQLNVYKTLTKIHHGTRFVLVVKYYEYGKQKRGAVKLANTDAVYLLPKTSAGLAQLYSELKYCRYKPMLV